MGALSGLGLVVTLTLCYALLRADVMELIFVGMFGAASFLLLGVSSAGAYVAVGAIRPGLVDLTGWSFAGWMLVGCGLAGGACSVPSLLILLNIDDTDLDAFGTAAYIAALALAPTPGVLPLATRVLTDRAIAAHVLAGCPPAKTPEAGA